MDFCSAYRITLICIIVKKYILKLHKFLLTDYGFAYIIATVVMRCHNSEGKKGPLSTREPKARRVVAPCGGGMDMP